MNPNASIQTSAGVPIAWAFIGTSSLAVFVLAHIAN